MIAEPAGLGAKIVNQTLAQEQWARDKLAAHAGRAFAVTTGPLRARWSIGTDGTLATAPGDAAIDVTLRISPLDFPALLAHPGRWEGRVEAQGDPALIATLRELASTMPWFIERAFGERLGPIAGQRVADAGRRLLQWPEYASQRMGDNVASFARDEASWLVRHAEFDAFRAQVVALGARVDAMLARFDRIASTAKPAPPAS